MKMFILGLGAILTLFTTSLIATEVRAANGITDEACSAINDPTKRAALGCDEERTVGNVGIGIIEVVISISGLIAAGFIVVGGVQYILSQGDPGKTKTAKTTILYAVVGLLVTVLAFAIVNFIGGALG